MVTRLNKVDHHSMAGIMDTSPPASGTGTAESVANSFFTLDATFNGTDQPWHISVTLKKPHLPESPKVSSNVSYTDISK